MITKEQQIKGQELMNSLVEKALENATFKEQLIKNPSEAIEFLTGKKFENKINIVVEDQTSLNHIYLNIPTKPKLDEFELTDEQLEMVSGGEFIVGGVIIGVAVGAALLGGGMYVGYHYL
jgi:hypothetical protein